MSWCCCDLDTVDVPTPIASAKNKPPTNVISVELPVVPKPITLMMRAQEPVPVLKIIPMDTIDGEEEKKTVSVDDEEDTASDEGDDSDSEPSTLYPDGTSLAAGACLMIYTLATIYMKSETDGEGGITIPGLNSEIP
jgi:hypothetical protein